MMAVITLLKSIAAIVGGIYRGDGMLDALGVSAAAFVAGFVCGVIFWSGKGLSRRLGRVGDALVGAITMLAFFVMILFMSGHATLQHGFRSDEAPMLFVGVFLGAGLGLVNGYDPQKHRRSADATKTRGDEA